MFDEEGIEFLNELSKMILTHNESRQYPDVITFGFWCRKAAVMKMKEECEKRQEGQLRIGRGVTFHIAPSNVPTMFAYSLVVALLSGNVGIVRLSNKVFMQVDIICECIRALIGRDKYQLMRGYIYIIRYDYDKDITDYLSMLCDVRIVWGGDQTIEKIRQSPLAAKSYELTFADRYSGCIINAKKLIEEKDIATVINGFYNDTYLMDQNGCSSPRVVIWIGDKDSVRLGKEKFWEGLHALVKRRYKIEELMCIEKYLDMCRWAIEGEKLRYIKDEDNYIVRLETNSLEDIIGTVKGTAGTFVEYETENLVEAIQVMGRKVQTITAYGIEWEQFQKEILNSCPLGIDRIVGIGKAFEFTPIWDGIDIFNVLSRNIDILL